MATAALQTIDTHHSSNIHDAQLDYYGKKLATASSDCKINIFEVVGDNQHNQLDSLSGHSGPVWQVGWAHPKFGVLLASCSYDKSVIIHRESPPGTWSPVHKHELHTASVNRCAACACSTNERGTATPGREGGRVASCTRRLKICTNALKCCRYTWNR